ncbi:MAG: glycine zipper family protein [Magnetococcus sp. DMHC-1]
MNTSSLWRCVPLVTLILAGCASAPIGPSVLAMPRSGRSFDQFRSDDAGCRQYSHGLSGGSEVVDSGMRSAVAGTVMGAAAGAALAGQHGAGVGAGAGLLVGSVAGIGMGQDAGEQAQRRYDYSYIQCMYAKGHQVPVPSYAVQTVHIPAYQGAVAPVMQMPVYQGVVTPTGAVYPPPPPPPGYVLPQFSP